MKLPAALLTAVLAAGAAAPADAAPWKRVTTPDGSEHRPGRVTCARADGVLHLAWHHPTGPEHGGPAAHGDLAGREDRRHDADPERLDGLLEPVAVVDPRRPRASGAASAPPTRATPAGDQHRAVGRRRRELGAAARVGQPRRRQSYAEPDLRDGAAGRQRRSRRGPGRSAPGCTPVCLRTARTTTTWSDLQYGNDPNLASDAAGRSSMAWYSSAPSSSACWRRTSPARARRSARRDDAGHGRDEIGMRAARRWWRGRAAASTSPIRPRRRRTGCACGASARATRRSSCASGAAGP